MQSIEHKYTNVSNLLDDIERMYFLTSDFKSNILTTRKFEPLLKLFKDNIYSENVIATVPDLLDDYTVLSYPIENDNVMVVCTSGGKDSIAVAKMYIKSGLNVILYHMHGINKAYWDEHTVIPQLAEILGCSYHIDDVKLKGKHRYIEHPMKNYIIANGAINYCVRNNLPTNIAVGNYYSSRLEDMEFEICAGDSRDMWKIYEDIIQNILPGFRIYMPLIDISNTYEVLGKDMKLISNCISCMSPYRFRKHWAERTENKYGVKLMPHRCGCCAKCCLEYMVLVDSGMLKYNKEYYDHCFHILKTTAQKETGVKHISAQEVWNRYFWYSVEHSHF